MNLSKFRDRISAGSKHLGISTLVAILAMTLVFVIWYPGPLARAQGVDRLVLLLIGIDVVIGPLITTIVFVRGKKGLSFDLAFIASLQTIALIYGMKAIYGGRPAYVVFNVDRFDVIASSQVDKRSLARVYEVEVRPSLFGPRWVAALLPDDPEKRNELLFSAVSGGPDLAQRPEYFQPLEQQREIMLNRLHPLDELRELNEMGDAEWRTFITELGGGQAPLGYLPMRANASDGVVILDARSGAIVGVRILTPSFDAPAAAAKKHGLSKPTIYVASAFRDARGDG